MFERCRFNMFLLFLAVCCAVNGLALVVVASIAIHAWYWVTWYWLQGNERNTCRRDLILKNDFI